MLGPAGTPSSPAAVAARFEKWQALGNDYLVVERGALPVPLDPAVVRRLCDRHAGVGADGVLELGPPDAAGFVARLRIFNPDGSEAELSGNGAREAVLYLRRAGWTDARQFSVQTAAGEVRPTILSATTCRMDLGARGAAPPGRLAAASPSSTCPSATPRRRSTSAPRPSSRRSTCRRSARRSSTTRSSRAARTSRGTPSSARRTLRARIFERGVGETQASGTGACGAAVAHVLRGGDSPVTVRLDGGELVVDVGEDLHVDLEGWAVPVFAGELSPELVADLRAADGVG